MTLASMELRTEPGDENSMISNGARWTGRVLSGLTSAFLLLDAAMKLARAEPALKATEELGYSASVVFPLGVVLLGCVVLYVVPRTRVLGAILLTGYLGGAVATHVRVGNPLPSHTLFPVYMGVALWLGLWLRDARLRALVPWSGGREQGAAAGD